MSQDNRSHSRLLEYIPETGTRRVFHWDAAEQSFTIENQFHKTEDVLEQNLLDRNNVNTSSWKGELHKVASLPLHVWFDLKQRGILNDKKKMAQWLNDQDSLPYRTRGGRV